MAAAIKIPDGWAVANIPDQTGKHILITGGTSGLGMESAKALVGAGAHVTITARTERKGEQAAKKIGGGVDVLELELADLASVRAAAAKINSLPYNFDVVLLNAGVMIPPFTHTLDGFELQMGTNHLGHFAFAGLIAPKINGRIVAVASQAHRIGSFGDGTFDEIESKCLGEGEYSRWGAYGASKLANLLFIAELERRRLAHHWPIIPIAAHPGWSHTNLFAAHTETFSDRIKALVTTKIAQSAAQGALPSLAAATFPALIGNSYLGPRGIGEMRGTPRIVRARSLAYDQLLGANLWAVSEKLTGVSWENSLHA
jgi:NAD(P)-dependent dehydrogenase (short-subunit alcohol dehydrogenase family)